MVFKILGTLIKTFIPSNHYWTVGLFLISLYVLHAFVQGRVTSRDRDLHARVFLITGGFTPMGVTLMEQLAKRGAQIIALTELSVDDAEIATLVTLLRAATSNDHIYAERCDLSKPKSIHAFCNKFLSGEEQRLDGIVFAHEYSYIAPSRIADSKRSQDSLSTFLIVMLLLPALLVAPAERDIRIIHICNPFYAAAIPTFASTLAPPSVKSKVSNFVAEGLRSLRAIIFIRHLQRVLDALPSPGQVPSTENSKPIISSKAQKSNIVCVSVCPGMSRSDIVTPLLGLSSPTGSTRRLISVCIHPMLFLITKSTLSSAQSVLHALFLPTPFKSTSIVDSPRDDSVKRHPLEVLKPGALYRECAVVVLSNLSASQQPVESEADNFNSQKDSEYGGERLGRLVWESYEAGLKEWESENAAEEGTS